MNLIAQRKAHRRILLSDSRNSSIASRKNTTGFPHKRAALRPHHNNCAHNQCPDFSEALPVHNAGPTLVILLLADPHALEGGKTRQNTSPNPHRVLALRRGYNLDLNRSGGERGDLLAHALADAREHGGSPRQYNVGIQVLTDIDVTLHDGLEGGVGDAVHLEARQVGLEQHLGTTETLVTNDDDVTVGELEALLEGGRLGRLLHLLLEVNSDKAQGLFDVTDNLTLGGGGERVTTLREDFHEV